MAATSENSRVWFKSISLENVRSFGEKQIINFIDKDGEAARWNIILGDNGTGKTTVLKALAVESGGARGAQNKFADYYNSFFRNSKDLAEIDVIHQFYNGDLQRYIMLIKKIGAFRVDQQIAPVYIEGKKNVLENYVLYNEYFNKIIVHGYGASRKVDKGQITQNNEKEYNHVERALTNVLNLFDENVSLKNVEEWLIQEDYIALKTQSDRNQYKKTRSIILQLLKGEVEDLHISTELRNPKVLFKTYYGNVSFHEMSLGYKTLIAWMVDFAKGLLDRYPDSPDPLAEPAVCLVDEIDLHLHPKFQRTIIKFLTDTFPNTQFIVTAHSPLIVVAAEERPLDANIILLKREGDQTVVVNDPVDVSKWSVDQILNSDLFGHVPARSQPVTELQTERDTLLSKSKLTKKEQVRLSELDEKIGFVPSGKDQTEIQAETIIQQLADVLRKQQAK